MSSVDKFLIAFLEIAGEAAPWLLVGFSFAGFVHEFLSIDKMLKHFGKRGALSILKASAAGIFLPMCSCGVIPAGIGMYKTGASLGSTLAFMTSTPAINPAAFILSFSLLGPKVALAYMLTAFISSFFIGLVANRFGGSEVIYRNIENERTIQLEELKETSLTKRVIFALKWGFFDLGTEIAFYVFIGFLLAAAISAFIPSPTIESYLGDNSLISLLIIALIGTPLYVCAVGSIPFVATLIAKGALPGVAIVFLMAGPATNAAELLAIYKSIGRRAAFIYLTMVILLSILGGYITNIILSNEKIFISAKTLEKVIESSVESSYLSGYYCSSYNLIALIILFALLLYGISNRAKTIIWEVVQRRKSVFKKLNS